MIVIAMMLRWYQIALATLQTVFEIVARWLLKHWDCSSVIVQAYRPCSNICSTSDIGAWRLIISFSIPGKVKFKRIKSFTLKCSFVAWNMILQRKIWIAPAPGVMENFGCKWGDISSLAITFGNRLPNERNALFVRFTGEICLYFCKSVTY